MLRWRTYLGTLVAGMLLAGTAVAQLVRAPSLQNLQGHSTTLAAYKGQILLINFWATWCAPCRAEMPELNQLFTRVDRRKLAIVGIAADEPAAVRAFVSRLGIRYPIAIGDADQVFAWSETLGNTSQGLPFSVLLDGDGRARWTKSGGRLTVTDVMTAINRLRPSGGQP